MRHSVENYIIYYIVIFSELYNFVSQILLLWREVAEDGAGNGFRDFVHV